MGGIMVNGRRRAGRARPENWGQLLTTLERGAGSERRIVTAVRFDGVDVPSFRDASSLSRPLEGLASIDVTTSTPRALLHESARSAYDAIAPLNRASIRIAAGLRQGDRQTAGRDLHGLMEALRTLATLTAMLVTQELLSASRADFDTLVARLCATLDRAIDLHSRSDWDAVADVLEKELAPSFDQWALVLSAVQGQTSARALETGVRCA